METSRGGRVLSIGAALVLAACGGSSASSELAIVAENLSSAAQTGLLIVYRLNSGQIEALTRAAFTRGDDNALTASRIMLG